MKVRMLFVPPAERDLKCGVVYDLADGKAYVSVGDAEKVADDVEALDDPRPEAVKAREDAAEEAKAKALAADAAAAAKAGK